MLFFTNFAPQFICTFSYLFIFIGFYPHFSKSVLIVLSYLASNFRCRAATVNLMVSLKSSTDGDSSHINLDNFPSG